MVGQSYPGRALRCMVTLAGRTHGLKTLNTPLGFQMTILWLDWAMEIPWPSLLTKETRHCTWITPTCPRCFQFQPKITILQGPGHRLLSTAISPIISMRSQRNYYYSRTQWSHRQENASRDTTEGQWGHCAAGISDSSR
jgi:hypothetical protein